jgi:hypothetical protein
MKTTKSLFVIACVCFLAFGCGRKPASETGASPTPQRIAGPLPPSGYKAQLSLPSAPTQLRAGQKETVQVRLKNASDIFWWARGGEINDRNDNMFYLATGNRWLKADGSVLTDMDGRHGIAKDLKPGEETEVPLLVTAPKDPGEYILEVDLIQEQVAWFSDKGSPTARAKVTVVK